MYNRGLFHNWVPKPVMLLLIILFLFPLLSVNGVYTGNNSLLVGDLAGIPEDMQMALYASTVGMMSVMPLLMRIKQYLRSKTIVVGSLSILALLSIVSGSTDNPFIIILCSFFVGFFKMFALIEFLLPVMFILSPTGDRGRFYSIFYPISIVTGQVSAYYFTVIASKLQWQNTYYFMAIILLSLALISIVFQHNQRGQRKAPLHYFDWLSIILISAGLMFLNYFFVYLKVLNGFNSTSIIISLAGSVILLGVFIFRQFNLQRPYLSLAVLKKSNVKHALIMITLLGVYMAASGMQSILTSGVLKYDIVTNASLNLWMIPGIIIAGIVSFLAFKREVSLKVIIVSGFAAFQLYLISLYFLVSPVIEISSFILPGILRGYAMTILFIGIGFYLADKLKMVEMLNASAVLVVVRSFVGTAFFGAIVTSTFYTLQWQHFTDLGSSLPPIDQRMIIPLTGRTQLQAMLGSMKELLGYTILAGWFIILYILTHHFGKTRYSQLLLIRIRARRRRNRKIGSGAETEAATVAV